MENKICLQKPIVTKIVMILETIWLNKILASLVIHMGLSA